MLLPRGRAREGNGLSDVLKLGLSGVLLIGHGDAAHFGEILVAGGKDCLVEKDEGEQDDEMLLRGDLAADFEGDDNIEWGAEDLDEEVEEELTLLWEESEELNSSSSTMSPSSPLIKMKMLSNKNNWRIWFYLGYMLPFRALEREKNVECWKILMVMMRTRNSMMMIIAIIICTVIHLRSENVSLSRLSSLGLCG